MDAPPPLNVPKPPPVPDGRRFRQIARASWLAAAIGILTIVLGMIAGFKKGVAEHPLVALFALAIFGIGCVLGVVALFGISQYGKRKILVPAITGIIVNLCLLALGLPNFLFAVISKTAHGPPAQLEPAVHSSSGRMLKDDRLGFSISIPEGFRDFPEAKVRASIEYSFIQGSSDRGEPVRFITIENLGQLIRRGERLTATSIAGADTAEITRRKWRGLEVDVAMTTSKDGDFTTLMYNMRIPLRPKAIDVVVAGAEADRKELSRLADQLLASMDGETNW